LLGGRLVYAQPAVGFRTGIEPVILAASVPAAAGDRVIEAGTGAGAGLLCLMARVGGLACNGIERDPAMAALARQNFDANGFGDACVDCADVAEWRCATRYHHAFANPPWHRGGTRSPEPGREQAKHAYAGLLHVWLTSLARGLHRRGTLSVIVPASLAAETMAAMQGVHCAEQTLIPLWPYAGTAAKLIIVRGMKEGRGGTTLHPGLALHEPGGAFTQAARLILEDSASLP
jgi:tRNA1(Val) A37 N6-methylase TrmN6